MTRRHAWARLVVATSALVFACHHSRPAMQPPTPTAAHLDAPPTPHPTTRMVRRGQILQVQAVDRVSTRSAEPGDRFKLALAAPLRDFGVDVLPAGTPLVAEVSAASRAGHLQEPRLVMHLVSIGKDAQPIVSDDLILEGTPSGHVAALGGGAIMGWAGGREGGASRGVTVGALAWLLSSEREIDIDPGRIVTFTVRETVILP